MPNWQGWHPTWASATCACASSVYTQTSALAVLKGSLHGTTDRGPNIVLASLCCSVCLLTTWGNQKKQCWVDSIRPSVLPLTCGFLWRLEKDVEHREGRGNKRVLSSLPGNRCQQMDQLLLTVDVLLTDCYRLLLTVDAFMTVTDCRCVNDCY